jgi:TolB-like protein/Tfp pilus assembly protein PilF
MITNDGKVKIMDFGLAKIKGGSQLTKMGSTVGTIAYMSPEQSGGDEVDNRADIWSFGVVLYEMLTGKMPFKGDYDQAVIYSILNEEPEIPEQLQGNLKEVLKKALAKNPDDRYKTAGEIAKDLHSIREGRIIKRTTNQSKIPWMIAGALVILIATVLYLFMPSSNNVEGIEAVKAIAVLPFVNISSDPEQEYFSDGLSEELLNVLAKNPRLRVTSRTSAFSFKGTNTDIKTIAAKLNVKHILEGSVRKFGNTLRIIAQLVDVETDAHLWSDTYDGTLENIFALQDSISVSVAEALKVALLGKETASQHQETDPEAYNAYLLGKHFFGLRGKENHEKAAGYFEKALSIDSRYAPGWVGLSAVHCSQADFGYAPVDEGYSKARQEALKALELDPNLADAQSRMGWIKQSYDWDWSGADESFKRALELEPGNASAISGASNLALILGRLDEAITLGRRSIEINPVAVEVYYNLGSYSMYAGLLEESIAAYRKCLELNPQDPGTHLYISLVYLAKKKPDSALAEVMKETDPLFQMQGLALVYYALGRKKEADDKLSELIKEGQNNAAYQIAEVYAYRGDKNKAFEWLDRAYDQRDGGLTEIKGDPLLRNIGKDPRYAVFMKKMKLPL